jgi:hypothetical protein
MQTAERQEARFQARRDSEPIELLVYYTAQPSDSHRTEIEIFDRALGIRLAGSGYDEQRPLSFFAQLESGGGWIGQTGLPGHITSWEISTFEMSLIRDWLLSVEALKGNGSRPAPDPRSRISGLAERRAKSPLPATR